jgi:hypothetical protein
LVQAGETGRGADMELVDSENMRRLISSAALALLIAFLVPQHTHRHDFDRAFTAWLHDKTPENEAALRQQQEINHRFEIEGSLIVALVLFTLFAGSSTLWAYFRRSKNSN